MSPEDLNALAVSIPSAAAGVVLAMCLTAVKRIPAVPSTAIERAVNEAPGAIAAALGATTADHVHLQDASAAIDAALNRFTATGLKSVADVCVLLRCLGADENGCTAVLLEKTLVPKLLDPIKAAPSIYTPANATGVLGKWYGGSFPLTAGAVAKLFAAAGTMITSKCNSAPERCTLLGLVFAVVDRCPPEMLPEGPAAMALLKPVIASPVPEVLCAAWTIFARLSSETQGLLEPAIKPVFKMIATNEPVRRAVLAGLKKATPELTTPAQNFLKGAIDGVEAYRGDAILALRHPSIVAATKTTVDAATDAVFLADGLDGLGPQAATVLDIAKDLAAKGIFRPLVVAAAHSDGAISKLAMKELEKTSAMGCGVAMSIWRVRR